MSKRSKKQRAKAQKAEVRRASGITLRAVRPKAAMAEVIELKRVAPKAEPFVAPVQEEAPSVPARTAIVPPKLEAPEEHRASRRVSVAVELHLWSESHFFSGLSGDISEGGLFLCTYRPLTIGMPVDVEFTLPGTEQSIHAHGEVRWIRDHSAEMPRGVGIAFEQLSNADRDAIHAFCNARPALYYDDIG